MQIPDMSSVVQTAQRYWWVMAVRGVIAILFGIAALFWPRLTLLILVYLFAAYILVDGVMKIIGSIQGRHTHSRWWVTLLGGIAGVIIALLMFFWPGITALIALYLVAIWAIITGIFEIGSAFSSGRPATQEWTLMLAGVLSVIFGIILLARPLSGLLALVWLIGIYAIILGIVLVIRAFQLKSYRPTYQGSY